MKIGLFFGSFNPFHIGHKAIASYMVEFTDLSKICFIVSPQSPHKIKKSLLDQYHRLMIIRMDIEDNPKLQVSDIEFSMPKPSYTIDTLTYLNDKHPNNEYVLIMGEDNLQTIHKWKNYKEILDQYKIYVYPRPLIKNNINHKNIYLINEAPQMDISASFIRKSIKQKKDVSCFIPERAWKYIDEMNFYKK